MSAPDPAADRTALLQRYATMRTLEASGRPELERVQPDRSGWSPVQHLAHVTLANERVLANLAALLAGTGLLVMRGGEPHPMARGLLAAGKLPRGEAQAPRMVRPPERVDRAMLAQWLAEGEAAVRALDPARLVPGELKIPHQLLGPLDAPEWLRFARVHSEHHLAIVDELLSA